MKKIILLASSLFFCANYLNAQITILDETVQERIVSKPRAFDSLSNISYQRNPVQYRQYIGYKLYCLPVSNKYSSSSPLQLKEFKYKTPREIIIPHPPYEKTDDGKLFVYLATTKREEQTGKIPDAEVSRLKGESLKQYRQKEAEYEKQFIISTDIYKSDVFESASGMPRNAIMNFAKNNIYTPYDSIQNTYFTVLNIEIADNIEAKKGLFSKLEEFDGRCDELSVLRFTLKNERNGEELYWVIECRDLKWSCMFLVPYFEKMQKTYKGKNVVPTKKYEQLADINTGEPVNINPGEVWSCYDVTFVNTKKQQFIQPYCILEKNGARVMIKFQDFTEKCRGMFSEEDHLFLPTFILEQEYNEIVAEKQRAAEERQRIADERQRHEELALQERNKQIMQKYGNKYGKLICEGKVCLNMTKEMCKEAWGEPLYVNSLMVKGLVHEQWVYWGSYLYFDNNTLTGIQN